MVQLIKRITASEFGLKFREKFFFPDAKKDPATFRHFNEAMDRFKKCDNKKSASQIKKEIRICKNYWHCYPYHYYIYGLYEAERQLTNEELINYIPHYYWYNLFQRFYDSQKYSLITDNKIVMHQMFCALNIRSPKTFCILFKGKLFSSNMEQLSFDKLNQELCHNKPEKIFVKPAEGGGGRGFFIFHKTDKDLFVTSEDIVFNENFLDSIGKKTDYIIQSGIMQDPEMSKIFPGSVNTCRIITENKSGGTPRVVCAILRIGQGRKEVDNISSGGICTNIDINTGKFGDFAMSYSGRKIEEHPDTHFKFQNSGVIKWDEIQNFTIKSAEKLPFFTYLGWDIALTAEGPIAVEMNLGPAIDIMEMISHGMRESFGIVDPDYYWKSPGKIL